MAGLAKDGQTLGDFLLSRCSKRCKWELPPWTEGSQSLDQRGAYFHFLPSLFSLSLLLPLFSFFLLFIVPKFLRELVEAPMDNIGVGGLELPAPCWLRPWPWISCSPWKVQQGNYSTNPPGSNLHCTKTSPDHRLTRCQASLVNGNCKIRWVAVSQALDHRVARSGHRLFF